MFECVWDMDSKNGYFKNLTCPMTFLDDLVFFAKNLLLLSKL